MEGTLRDVRSCNLAKQKSSARRECWPSIKRNATLSQLSRLLSNACVPPLRPVSLSPIPCAATTCIGKGVRASITQGIIASRRTPCYRSLRNLRLGTRGVLGEGSNRKLAAYVANDLNNSIIRWL